MKASKIAKARGLMLVEEEKAVVLNRCAELNIFVSPIPMHALVVRLKSAG